MLPIKIIKGKINKDDAIFNKNIDIGKILIDDDYPFGLIKTTAEKFDFEAIESALALYKLDNGKYPTQELGFGHLINGDNGSKYLSKIPEDPWGSNYVYKMENNVVEIISIGPDGLLDGPEDDDITHILK